MSPQFGGQRAKLVACDGNEIDAMVIDRRGRDPRGDTLVRGGSGARGEGGGFGAVPGGSDPTASIPDVPPR